MKSLTLSAPAKLNLFLHITGRRKDGYHNLQTVFQFINLSDELEFTVDIADQESNTVQLNTQQDTVLAIKNEDNLIWKAAQALRKTSGSQRNTCITLTKNLPMGAGIGGGSSDAATTLLALNHLWGIGASLDELATIGQSLGADVPVFIQGFSAFAEGIGEQLHPIDVPETWFLLIKPSCTVSTSEVFSHPELTRDTAPITIAAFLSGVSRTHNDCLPVVQSLYPEVKQAIEWLRGFAEPHLTGTGACIFAQFEREQDANAVLSHVPSIWQGYVAQGVNISPTHRQLTAVKGYQL